MARKRGGFKQKEAEEQVWNMIPEEIRKKICEDFKIKFSENFNSTFIKALESRPEVLAQTLKSLCEKFLSEIKKIGITEDETKKQQYTMDAYSLGLKIIYNFRNLFFHENFVLRYALKAKDNNGKTKEVIIEINYNDLINKQNKKGQSYLDFTKAKNEIHFAEEAFEDLAKKDINSAAATKYFDLWNDILQFAGTEDDSYMPTGILYKRYDKKIKIYKFSELYKHDKEMEDIYRIKDGNNYSYFYTKPEFFYRSILTGSSYSHSFYIEKDNGSTLKYFNRGFLFEWYEKYLTEQINKNSERSTKYRGNFFKNNKESAESILRNLLEENATDNIEGYRAGDYFDEKLRIMYQVKYYKSNSLITFNGIEKAINTLLKMVNEYEEGIEKLKKNPKSMIEEVHPGDEFFNNLFDFYTPESDLADFKNYLGDEENNKITLQL